MLSFLFNIVMLSFCVLQLHPQRGCCMCVIASLMLLLQGELVIPILCAKQAPCVMLLLQHEYVKPVYGIAIRILQVPICDLREQYKPMSWVFPQSPEIRQVV